MKRVFWLLLIISLHVPEASGVCVPTCDGGTLNVVTNCCAFCDGNLHPVNSYPSPCQLATDDTCSINLALDAVSAADGGEVYIPPGTCLISPKPATSNPPPPPDAFLRLYSNITIRGAGPKSVLQVANGAGDYTAIFEGSGCPNSCPSSLSNVTFKDFRVAQNVANNPANLQSPSHFVIISGLRSDNTIVRTTGFTISGMNFDETDSSNTIWLTNQDAGVPLQATISNNYFHFVRNPSPDPPDAGPYDVSTILTEGSQYVITGNTFTTSPPPRAPEAAMAVLSGRNVIANNTIVNYNIALHVLPSFYTCSPDTSTCNTIVDPNETVIANNSVTCARNGIQIWPTTGVTLRNLSITGNSIDVCNMTRAVDPLPADGSGTGYSGIQTVVFPAGPNKPRGWGGDVDGLTISENIITMQKENRSYGTVDGVYKYTAGILLFQIGSLANVLVKGNIVKDSPLAGIRVEAVNPGTSVSRLRILDNIIVDSGNNSAASTPEQITYRHAIGVFNLVNDVDIARNLIYDTATRPPTNQLWGQYALYLQQDPLSTNIRTSQNTVRTNSGSAQLVSSQASAGLKDATSASDVLISPITASGAALNVDFMSYTQYITTIANSDGSLTVARPAATSNFTQWTVGQAITFRFLCTAPVACTVHFNAEYSTAGDLTIDSGKGRAITFQVENWFGGGPRYFFELYRTPTGVPNP